MVFYCYEGILKFYQEGIFISKWMWIISCFNRWEEDKNLFLFVFMFVCTWVQAHAHIQVPGETGWRYRWPLAGVTINCEMLIWVLGTESGSGEEQQVLLPAVPSLHPLEGTFCGIVGQRKRIQSWNMLIKYGLKVEFATNQ